MTNGIASLGDLFYFGFDNQKRMRAALFLFFTVYTLQVGAQQPVEFARLGVNEGLSQNSVYAIHQDEQGFIWIGTGDGLNRFDGKTFKIFRERWGDTSSRNMPGRRITGKIIQDQKQRLWFTTNKGLVQFNKTTERFSQPLRHLHHLAQTISVIGIDEQQSLWLAVNDSTFYKYDLFNGSCRTLSFPNLRLAGMASLANGYLYFIGSTGLFEADTRSLKVRRLVAMEGLTTFRALHFNEFWLSTANQMYLYRYGSKKLEPFVSNGGERTANPIQRFSVVHQYPAGVYYILNAAQGLVRYNRFTNEWQPLRHEPRNRSSLSNDYILTGFADRSNNLWLGTEGGGISRLDLKPGKFNSFPSYTVNTQQAANLMVKSIHRWKTNILVGTFSQGLYVVDAVTHNFRRLTYPDQFSDTVPPSINVLQTTHDGALLMAIGSYICLLSPNDFSILAAHQLQNSAAVNVDWIYSLLEYEPNRFLVGTLNKVFRMECRGQGFRSHRVEGDSILDGHLQTLQKAQDGTVYGGRIGKGFCRVRIKTNGLEKLDAGYAETGIRHFYFDRKAPIVWMASESGLIAYNPATKKGTVYDTDAGLSNSYIYSILSANDSTFWVSTNKGLNRVGIRRTINEPDRLFVSAYTQVDGLQSNEFNTGAFHQSASGELYFGGVNGINWFRGNAVISNRHRPQVVLTSLAVNENEFEADTSVPYLQTLRLPHDLNTISFRFASLEFTNAQANVYSYQMEGIDKEWIDGGSLHEARYANLPPGNYKFKVRGTNSDGIWSESPRILSVEIVPAFWQTTSFKIALSGLFALLLTGIVRMYISMRVKNKVKELEKQKAVNEERLRISRDMHDELGTGLTKIALLSEVTGYTLQKKVGDMKPLQEITATSRQLTQKMGEIIWTLNPVNDTLDNLTAYLHEQLYDWSEGTDIELETHFPTNVPSLPLTNRQRQQLLLVTKEAFHNVMKHAGARSVHFTLQLSQRILFRMEDDGKGFDERPIVDSTNGKRNGLSNMAWRMQQEGGGFRIVQRPGGGTMVEYWIPVSGA